MNKLISLITLCFCFSAFAQERVVLTSSKATVNGPEAILVRTAQTPEVVEVRFQVPMSGTVCHSYSTRFVTVTSAARCGTIDRVNGYTTRNVCVRTNPHNGQCLRTETQRIPVVSRQPRTCTVTESYCSSYGTVTSYESDTVKIKFKKLPALGGTEEDTFSVRARQRSHNGENVVYDITPIQTAVPYEVKSKGFFGYDSYVIKVE
jgi:hypothetical protein